MSNTQCRIVPCSPSVNSKWKENYSQINSVNLNFSLTSQYYLKDWLFFLLERSLALYLQAAFYKTSFWFIDIRDIYLICKKNPKKQNKTKQNHKKKLQNRFTQRKKKKLFWGVVKIKCQHVCINAHLQMQTPESLN